MIILLVFFVVVPFSTVYAHLNRDSFNIELFNVNTLDVSDFSIFYKFKLNSNLYQNPFKFFFKLFRLTKSKLHDYLPSSP